MNTVTPQTNVNMTIDMLRSKAMGRILLSFLDVLDSSNLPESMNRNVIAQTRQQVERLDREILRVTQGIDRIYLTKAIKQDKLFDIALVMDNMLRIGCEENPTIYEEFVTLLTGTFDAVFYSQKHRRNLHFGKYKALFNLIKDEIEADTNKQKSAVLYSQGELFIRSHHEHSPIKPV